MKGRRIRKQIPATSASAKVRQKPAPGKREVDPRKRLAFNVEVTEEALTRAAERGGRRPPIRDAWDDKKGEQFCEELRNGSTVLLAAEAVQLSRTTLYRRRQEDTTFAAAWDTAYEQGTDALEQEAERRALKGVTEPVFYKGEVCGHVQKYSDVLLIFLLKARRPEKFRDKVDLSNKDGSLAEMAKGFAEAVRRSAS